MTALQPSGVTVDFCGERHAVDPEAAFTIGREGDVVVDDNPYLHRRFLLIEHHDGLWRLSNVGNQLTATVADADGSMQSWLAPGGQLPVVFATTIIRFTAGPTTYELRVELDEPLFESAPVVGDLTGDTTIGPMAFTPDQLRLIVALAEPMLLGDGIGAGSIPASAEAARRLGWTITKFNRKLDNVCEKLTRAGVRGLHGSSGALASNRRSRLVEYALAARLVARSDLDLLEQETGVGD
jgi:hypothetical protein